MHRAETDGPSKSPEELEAITHGLARHVVAGHSESAEELMYFLTMLGIEAGPPRASDGSV